MKTIKCKCENQGMLLIGVDYMKNEDGSVPSYESGNYTERKAKNDFNALAIERQIKTDVAGLKYTE